MTTIVCIMFISHFFIYNVFFFLFLDTQIGLLSGLLTIPGPPEIDYAATEALIEAEGGKHVRAKDGR